MRILIAYGTIEGQTRKIASFLAKRVRELGHEADVFDTAETPSELRVDAYDRIIVAASVHQQRHPESVAVFIVALRAELAKKPTLFLSVSLSAAFPQGMKDARHYVDAFLADNHWHPTESHTIAGALRYAEYDYFKEQIIQHIVLKDHNMRTNKRDYEFTDWIALAQIVDSFLRS